MTNSDMIEVEDEYKQIYSAIRYCQKAIPELCDKLTRHIGSERLQMPSDEDYEDAKRRHDYLTITELNNEKNTVASNILWLTRLKNDLETLNKEYGFTEDAKTRAK